MSARVLVVDDVPLNLKLLQTKLELEYYEVLTAASGAQALAVARAEAPEILLLDIMMPDINGYEVCRQLKAEAATQDIPVVMITALSNPQDKVLALECGADDFLTKPVDDTALFARVRSLVRLKRTMDEWRLREGITRDLGVVAGIRTDQADLPVGARVVVVEDASGEVRAITEVLTALELIVDATSSLEEGLKLARKGPADLVMISLSLRDEDGLRLCSQLRNHESLRQIPILLLAHEAEMDRVVKGLELGANDYLIRPIDDNELKARVSTQVRRKRYQDRLRLLHQRSFALALTDPLTGLFNRHYLTAHFARMLARIAETRKPVAVIMIDIDNFKLVNDRHGHPVGDAVLKDMAGRISRNLRNFDLVARYGGEEFMVVMPDVGPAGALMVAERLRESLAETPFHDADSGVELKLTVSMGVSWTDDPATPPEELIASADRALYAAKDRGRNCVVGDLEKSAMPPASA